MLLSTKQDLRSGELEQGSEAVDLAGKDTAHMRTSRRDFWWWLVPVGLTLLILAPYLLSEYNVVLLREILILAIMVSGLNLLLGYTGLVSLGHAAFIGVGAYVTAVGSFLWGYPVWAAMFAAVLISLVVAYLVGLLSVRTRGVQFLLITLAFGQMFYAVAEKNRYTGGDDGLSGIPRIDLTALGFDANDDRVFYYFVLVCFAVALAVLRTLIASPFGTVLIGIRENEKRMTSIGYRTYPYKALAFGVSGMMGGLAGSLWVQHSFFVNPHIVTWQMSGEALLMVIIGGSQAFFGPLFGVAFYVLTRDVLSEITKSYLMIFGLLFVLVVAFFNGGIAGLFTRLGKRIEEAWAQRRSGGSQ